MYTVAKDPYPEITPWQEIVWDDVPYEDVKPEPEDEVDKKKRKADAEEKPETPNLKKFRNEKVQETVNERLKRLFGEPKELQNQAKQFKASLFEDSKCIGNYVPLDKLKALLEKEHDKNFVPGELVLANRTQGGFQFVLVLGQNENIVCFDDESQILKMKSTNFFYHLPPKANLISEQDLAHEQKEAEDLAKRGDRSIKAVQFASRLKCAQNMGTSLVLRHNEYTIITGGTQSFSSKCLASCGSTPDREIILFDPNHSPKLFEHFEQMKNEIFDIQKQIGSLTNQQILHFVMNYTNKFVFSSTDPNVSEDRAVDRFVRECANKSGCKNTEHLDHPGVKIPLIPLNEFISAGKGCCRQKAMFICIILDLLTRFPEEKPVLNGIIQLMRDNLALGLYKSGHAWVTFIPKAVPGEGPQKWHLDAHLGILQKFALLEGRKELDFYGSIVETEIKRTARAAELCGQPKE